MTSTLIKSYEIDGVPVEIRIDDNKEEDESKVVARFIYELLCK